jgi:RNA polymerase sigma-70 factor, ECF subfamily
LFSFSIKAGIPVSGPVELLTGLAHFSRGIMKNTSEIQDSKIIIRQDLEDIQSGMEGDEDAFRRLISRHQNMVARMMWRFSRDPEIHEELVQDVFVEVYLSLSKYKGKAPFSHWISKIATRAGLRFWKKRAKEREHQTFSLQDWDKEINADQLEKLQNSEAADILHKLLGQLNPRDRLVLTLRYMEDYSVEETADLSGWTRTMVKVQSWRARKNLKKLLEKAGLEDIR